MRSAWLIIMGLVCLWAVTANGARAAAMADCALEHQGLTEMLGTERAFADKARSSVRSAFLEYLAQDSWVLQPGPTPGRAFYAASRESHDTLAWYPSLADVAQSGDLGFTGGPWVFTVIATGAKLYGHFLTIWKRDENCLWRVVFDGGVSHAPPIAVETKLAPERASRPRNAPPAALVANDAVSRAMSDFQLTVQQNGLPAGFRTYARNGDFEFYGEGQPPLGIAAATGYLGKKLMVAEWRENTRGRSTDSTLAYSIGELALANQRVTHAYAQIWQYDPKVANWGLRIFLMTPLSEKK